MRARNVGLFVIAAGLLTLFGSCRAMNHAYALRASGIEAVGRVVASEASGEGGVIEVEYRVKGEVYRVEFEVDRTFLLSHRVNAKCDLLYLADEPEDAILPTDSSLSGSTTILLLLGAVGLLALGGILAVLSPGDGNIFRRGGTPLGPSPDAGDGDAREGDDDESPEDPVYVMGRPL